MFRKTVLPNKLRIITAPMRGTNTISILVLCGTGSDNEPTGRGGISHFLEHMFFKGTKKRPTPQSIMQETDSMGSLSNAFTAHELTGYFIKAGKMYLDQSLDLLADVYQNSLLKKSEIDREKQVVVEELQYRRDDPSIYIWRLWEELLYGKQHAGLDVIGTEKIIRSFTHESLSNYFRSQYTSKNTVIIVAGNFDESRTLSKITKLFDKVRDGSPRPSYAFKERQLIPDISVHFKESDQTHIMVGFRGFSIHDKDRYVADLLDTITGSSHSSRMFDAVRERRGLAYTVFSSTQAYSNRGYFTTYAAVSHANAEKAIRTILGEYKKLADHPVGSRELKRAKDHLKGTSLMQLESSSAVANFVGIEEAMTGHPLTIEEVFAKIDAISATDILRVARRLFRKARLNIAVIGPFKDVKKFEKLLRI